MCEKKVSDAEVQPAGRVSAWDRVSVCVLPCPPSQASMVPPWAGSAVVALEMRPLVWAHGVVPFSKPPLPTIWSPQPAAWAGGVNATTVNRLTASVRAAENTLVLMGFPFRAPPLGATHSVPG